MPTTRPWSTSLSPHGCRSGTPGLRVSESQSRDPKDSHALRSTECIDAFKARRVAQRNAGTSPRLASARLSDTEDRHRSYSAWGALCEGCRRQASQHAFGSHFNSVQLTTKALRASEHFRYARQFSLFNFVGRPSTADTSGQLKEATWLTPTCRCLGPRKGWKRRSKLCGLTANLRRHGRLHLSAPHIYGKAWSCLRALSRKLTGCPALGAGVSYASAAVTPATYVSELGQPVHPSPLCSTAVMTTRLTKIERDGAEAWHVLPEHRLAPRWPRATHESSRLAPRFEDPGRATSTPSCWGLRLREGVCLCGLVHLLIHSRSPMFTCHQVRIYGAPCSQPRRGDLARPRRDPPSAAPWLCRLSSEARDGGPCKRTCSCARRRRGFGLPGTFELLPAR